MAPKDREFQHESAQDRKSIVSYLQALSEGFANGSLTLSDQTGEIVLRPHGLVRLEITAHQKRDRTRMTVRFDWKEEEDSKTSSGGPLMIRGDKS